MCPASSSTTALAVGIKWAASLASAAGNVMSWRARRWRTRGRRRRRHPWRPRARPGRRRRRPVTVCEAPGRTSAAAQVGKQDPVPAGQLVERFAQVGVVPVGAAVDDQQRAFPRPVCLSYEQLDVGLRGHAYQALGEHHASLPDRTRWSYLMSGLMSGLTSGRLRAVSSPRSRATSTSAAARISRSAATSASAASRRPDTSSNRD